MGRKSLAPTRRAEILDAFEECIVTHGLEASSFQRIAATAGMDRAMIRHYFGTREALVDAVVERAVGRWTDLLSAAVENGSDPPLGDVVDVFFGPDLQGDRAEALWLEVTAFSARSEPTRKALTRAYKGLFAGVKNALKCFFPDVPTEERTLAAFNIVALLERSGTFAWVGMDRRSIPLARTLIGRVVDGLADLQEEAAAPERS